MTIKGSYEYYVMKKGEAGVLRFTTLHILKFLIFRKGRMVKMVIFGVAQYVNDP